MRTVERFLRDGDPLPAAARALPDPWRHLTFRAALTVRWQRWHDRVRHNLAAFDEVCWKDDPRALLARLAANMATVASMGSGLRFSSLGRADVEGQDELLAAVATARDRGRGLVVSSAHFGFWQLPLLQLSRVAPTWLMDPYSARLRPVSETGDERLARWSESRPLQRGEADGWTLAVEALARNEIVAVIADLPRRGGRTETVSFLGRRLRIPAAPAVLAQVGEAPLLPYFANLEGTLPHVWTGPTIEPTYRTWGDSATVCTLQCLANVFSAAIRERPDHWLGWIHPWSEPVRTRELAPVRAPRARLAMAAG